MMSCIKNLIICGPYKAPSKHWRYNRSKRRFELVPGRRPAGFLIASPDSKAFDDPGEFRELELVNRIRDRVDAWRESGYPGVTTVTKDLLEFWKDDPERDNRLFFCQMEAMETLIWLVEAPDSERRGIIVPSDGGLFQRLCCKMATGTGKTVVMAMLIVWQVINKAKNPKDARFSKNILIMAPGLTVKSRLQVLIPKNKDNFYDSFNIVPDSFQKMFRGKFNIHNWHTLMPEMDAPKNVVKLGEESNEAFSKRILDHDYNDLVVINDEAHHAYRASNEQIKNISKRDLERDRRWIEGLDRIHNARRIIKCFDFSATPFIPSGKNVSEDTLFDWIVSDFSLNDAIESGLTKTPMIAIRDDSNKFSKDYRSRFYHIYKDDEVRPDLNRKAKPHEKLPDLVANAYFLLGQDWLETKKTWDDAGSIIPPVMITVCNNTQTAARVMHSFEKKRFDLKELSKEDCLLHIDTTTMAKAEGGESSGSDAADSLRRIVDTVGKLGEPGEQIRNIIAVQMLSEGWDARNVTHIMGLRAFSSQLLCEQVVGRGLRRTSYDVDPKTGLYSPEYVNVFGVPFTFLPHEGDDGTPPPKPISPPTLIEPNPEKNEHIISWPNIDRIDADFTPKLTVDWKTIEQLELRSDGVSTTVSTAPILAGKPYVDKMSEIDLRKLDKKIRLQRIVFLAAKDVYGEMLPAWRKKREYLLMQVVKLVEEFIHSGGIVITDVADDELRVKMTILFNMQKVVYHVCKSITDSNVEGRRISLNPNKPKKSTSDMRPWYTKRQTVHSIKSHINLAVCDSKWEMSASHELDRNRSVVSWVKNDHIGFVIKYMYNGVIHDYWPDFIIRLVNGVTLVLEIKGVDSSQNKAKRKYLKDWVDAVNEDGGYGTWTWDVAFNPGEVRGIIDKHSKTEVTADERAKCPKCFKICHLRQEIEKEFGFRNEDGIIRPQSWCKKCRKAQILTRKSITTL